MKLQDLPRILPGADVRIRIKCKLCFVTVRHEGKEGHGTHRKLTFATRRAVLSLGQVIP